MVCNSNDNIIIERIGKTMFQVKDGARTLQFEGEKLAVSSSYRPGSNRWIEFSLFKTLEGNYVLARVGVSNIYHTSTCTLVARYGLHETTPDRLDAKAVPCEECNPSFYNEVFVFPEKYRYWTLVSQEPDAVLEALYKRDDFGARYLTKVAQRLLDTAAENDAELDQIYRVETIR
jgi:hypothetical protein